MNEQLLIAVKALHFAKYVAIKKFDDGEDLTANDILQSILEETNISIENFDRVVNMNQIEIPFEYLVAIVLQQKHQPSFVLEIKTKSDRTSEICNKCKATQSNELISYFQQSEENSKVLQECKNSKNISVVSRRAIVNIVAKYIEETFDYNPPPHSLLEISKLTVEIFPGLKATVGDVTDLLCNKANTGFLQIKLKNDRAKRRKLNKEFQETGPEEEGAKQLNESEVDAKLQLLNTLPVNGSNDYIKEILKETVFYRRTSNTTAVYECFVSNPDLV